MRDATLVPQGPGRDELLLVRVLRAKSMLKPDEQELIPTGSPEDAQHITDSLDGRPTCRRTRSNLESCRSVP